MLDYAALHCFAEVLRYGSFERGAQALNLTQSAISQKIKRLEQSVGGPVLIRSKPIKATPLGQQLLEHQQKVSLLEEQLTTPAGVSEQRSPLNIAVNNDVLATWFADVMACFSQLRSNPVHVFNADQSQTRSLLQQGKVIACISQTGTPVTGGQSIRLGNMAYQLYASPGFIHQHLSTEITAHSVMAAPGLLYDEFDVGLLSDYQRECLDSEPRMHHCHWYPSSHGFVQMAINGVAWALLPTLQVRNEVESGQLISLFPDKQLKVPLFWHWIELESVALSELGQAVKMIARQQLEARS